MTDLPNAHKLLECLAQEPVKKKDLRKLLSHSKQYTNEEIDLAADLIEKCLRAFPGDRVSAAEALQHPFLN
jgi:serine/threonine protein kinase